ncbi:MAG: hypothetical protein ABIC95_05060 [archaeon]
MADENGDSITEVSYAVDRGRSNDQSETTFASSTSDSIETLVDAVKSTSTNEGLGSTESGTYIEYTSSDGIITRV